MKAGSVAEHRKRLSSTCRKKSRGRFEAEVSGGRREELEACSDWVEAFDAGPDSGLTGAARKPWRMDRATPGDPVGWSSDQLVTPALSTKGIVR